MPGFPVLEYLLEFAQTMFIESVMLSNYPVLCCSLAFSLPASGYFPVDQLFTLGGQSIGASALVVSMNIQG